MSRQPLATSVYIEAVLFDLDDTLVQTTYFNETALGSVVKELSDRRIKLGISAQDLPRLVHNARRDYGAEHAQLLQEFEKTLGISDEKTLTELVIAYEKFEDSSLRLFPGVTSLLKLLIRNKIKMGVVTNGDTFRQWKKMLVLGIADLFDFVAISASVGIEKPDPQIFRLALDSLSADPTKSVFVGDRPDLDTKGAKQSGMYTVRVRQGRASSMQPSDILETADAELMSVGDVGGYLFGP